MSKRLINRNTILDSSNCPPSLRPSILRIFLQITALQLVRSKEGQIILSDLRTRERRKTIFASAIHKPRPKCKGCPQFWFLLRLTKSKLFSCQNYVRPKLFLPSRRASKTKDFCLRRCRSSIIWWSKMLNSDSKTGETSPCAERSPLTRDLSAGKYNNSNTLPNWDLDSLKSPLAFLHLISWALDSIMCSWSLKFSQVESAVTRI